MGNRRFYNGQGERNLRAKMDLPVIDPQALLKPEDYLAAPELAAAVDVALTLGMPLLLTGEPGSGKSALAESVAYELNLGTLLEFTVKSDTESRDLFYRFDTVGRFHAAQTLKDCGDEGVHPGRFITFEALGQALLYAKPGDALFELNIPETALEHPGKPRRTVVLIDEIDKAPRDVPNDILVEIERMRFDIPELAGAGRPPARVSLGDSDNLYRPIVIFTSNSEKALPDPFLRRCVCHHLQFPPFEAQSDTQAGAVTVEAIVAARLGQRYQGGAGASQRVADAIGFFRFLRSERCGSERQPTLAELLNWLDYLMPQGEPVAQWHRLAALDSTSETEHDAELCASITSLLLKKPADQGRALQWLQEWRKTSAAR